MIKPKGVILSGIYKQSLLAFFSLSTLLLSSFFIIHKNKKQADIEEVTVPLGGNTFLSGQLGGGNISDQGIVAWRNPGLYFITYIRVSQTGRLKLSLNLNVPDGSSSIKVTVGSGPGKAITASGTEFKDFDAGEWNIRDTGYVKIIIKGIRKTGSLFANITSLKLSGPAINHQTAFVKNNGGNFFYWGRRGPSVHLNYRMPANVNAEWFYNEVTVPKGNDVIGSYFMADGFAEGYFGMQVNSATERRILFSVWSPFQTDDPNRIPDEKKIRLLKKGANVHAGEFGNEGSGGQSYLNYNWAAAVTYRFLIHAQPGDDDHTQYTAYFYAPEQQKWLLIASFSRPATHTYLKQLHSFLEDFEPNMGAVTRKVLFNNQWIKDAAGNWLALTEAKFTGDNTAIQGYRMDYAGGLSNNMFYLQNCGFFNNYTPLNTMYIRMATTAHPTIDFAQLP